MKLRTLRGRAAFTLVELLVVIAIIAILVSLITAAVQRVRVLGPQTENFHRIEKVAQAISSVKTSREQGGLGLSWIPSGGGFRLKSTYAVGDPELDILLQAWPNLNFASTGLPNVTLDGNQTLMFFLTGGTVTDFKGFATNPKQPFTLPVGGESRRGPYLGVDAKLFVLDGQSPPQAWLVDVYGTPFAYLASVGGKQNNYGAQTYTVGSAGTVSPYKSSATKFMNENGFQIISAGKDKVFGPGGLNLPATGTGLDDQSNFTRTILGAGIN